MHIISPASNLNPQIVLGAAEIAIGLALEVVAPGNPLSTYLIIAGISTIVSGVGTLLSKGPLSGTGMASRNPIAPWNVVYGRAKVGGIIVYISEFDDDNKFLDLVVVLACHACESVDSLLLDGKRVQIDPDTGCSFTPVQQTISISNISRTADVVTVSLPANIPLLEDGDDLIIRNVAGDATMNGKYPVTVVSRVVGGPGSIIFSYICGGAAGSFVSDGEVKTTWPDYGAKIYMESLLGDHTDTFVGMTTGTPYDGDTGSLVNPDPNPWTSEHKLLGKTCVFLRLHYNDKIFANGLPSIAFHVHGKNDIADYATSPPTIAYTTNPALCIADYLSNTTWGFKATYGTEIPLPELIAAQNICDELVTLAAGGTEKAYTCNGQFPLTMKRGEVLQNLLTSCGGRLTYQGGKFVIHPAACVGVSFISGGGAPTLQVRPTAGHLFPGTAECSGTGFVHASTGKIQRWCYSGLSFPAVGKFTSFPVPSPELLVSAHLTMSSSGGKYNNPDDATPSTYDGQFDVLFGVDGAIPFSIGFGTGFDPTSADRFTAINTVDLADSFDITTVDWSKFNAQFKIDGSLSSAFDPWAGNEMFIDDVYLDLVYDTSRISSTDLGGTILNVAAGPFRWRQKLASRDLFNGVKGTYVSPTNNWQSSDIPPYAQDNLHGYHSGSPEYPLGDANLAEDGGDRRWKDIQLPFTISVSTAQRLCKIELLRTRHQGTGTFIFNMAMYQLTALDVIAMTLPVLGWENKTLEVQAHRFTLQKQNAGGQEVTLLGTEIDVQEYDCSTFDWDPSEELSAQGFQNAVLPSNVNRLGGITTTVNPQTGTTYTVQISDRGKLVSLGNASPVAVTLPKAGEGPTDLGDLWNAYFQNTGAGLVTITPSGGSLIDGAATLALKQNEGVHIFSDGTNFYTERGSSTSATFVDNETPAGTSPLSTVYTLAHAPNPSASLMLYVNGVLQIPSTDFTLSSATITFTNAPDVNDIIRAFYRYQP